MKCPSCGEKTRVTETRDTGDVVYRTRRCDACEWLVTTKEEYIDGLIPKGALKQRDWKKVWEQRSGRSAHAER